MLENGVELESLLDSKANENNLSCIDVKDCTERYSIDLIVNCALGIKANCLINENSEFKLHAHRIFDFNLKRSIEFFSVFFMPELVKILQFKVR